MAIVLNGNVKIHYEVEGEGDCLVLQHGFFGCIEDWYEFGYVDALKKSHRLVLVDARGHGASDKPRLSGQYSPYLRATDVIKALDDLKIDRCHYFGFSMGGWIGFGLMKWFGERFQSFILDAIHPYENDMAGLREAVESLEQWVPQSTMSEANKSRFLLNDKAALLAAAGDTRPDNTTTLRNLTGPCLLMDGENDEIYEKVKSAASLSDKIELVTIPGADHVESLHKSEFVVPRIEAFIGMVATNHSI